MIQLTRLRRNEQFFLNPDLFERVDTHVESVIRLVDGTEYVVVETGAEIARRVAEFRAQVIAIAAMLQSGAVPSSGSSGGVDSTVAYAADRTPAELDAPVPDGSRAGQAGAGDPAAGDGPDSGVPR